MTTEPATVFAGTCSRTLPRLIVGTLRGQDIGKALILGVLGIGTVLATLGVMLDAQWPQLFLDVFKDVK